MRNMCNCYFRKAANCNCAFDLCRWQKCRWRRRSAYGNKLKQAAYEYHIILCAHPAYNDLPPRSFKRHFLNDVRMFRGQVQRKLGIRFEMFAIPEKGSRREGPHVHILTHGLDAERHHKILLNVWKGMRLGRYVEVVPIQNPAHKACVAFYLAKKKHRMPLGPRQRDSLVTRGFYNPQSANQTQAKHRLALTAVATSFQTILETQGASKRITLRETVGHADKRDIEGNLGEHISELVATGFIARNRDPNNRNYYVYRLLNESCYSTELKAILGIERHTDGAS